MINEQNPNEDDITKIDLLNRIAGLRGIIESAKGELNSRMDTVKPSIVQDVNKIIGDALLVINQSRCDLDSVIVNFRVELGAALKDSISELAKKVSNYVDTNEKRLKMLEENLGQLVIDKSLNIFTELERIVKNMKEDSDASTKEITEAINKFQTETREKAGALDGKFESILGKFRDILKFL